MFIMRKQIRTITGKLLVAGLLVTGLTTGASVYAANAGIGAVGASADTKYSLEEMLVYAIEDEYLAQAEYDVIMDTFIGLTLDSGEHTIEFEYIPRGFTSGMCVSMLSIALLGYAIYSERKKRVNKN